MNEEKDEAVLVDIESQKEIARQWQAKMPNRKAVESVVVFNKFVRAIDRLEMLRKLPENHGGEAEAAPDQSSAETAKLLLMALASGTVRPTFSFGGMAVIEIEDWSTGLYAEIAFTSESAAEIYVRMREPPRQPAL